MEFNIIGRRPKYLTEGCNCIFDFQVDQKPEVYQVEMIYTKGISHGIYYFKSENKKSADIDLFKDRADLRSEFRKEVEKWSKGGSYRKTHPIVLDKLGKLKKEQFELWEKERKLNDEIKNEENIRREKKLKEYKENIDFKLVNTFINKVNKFLKDSRFCLRYIDYEGLYLYDKIIQKYIVKCNLYDDEITTEEIGLNKIDLFL